MKHPGSYKLVGRPKPSVPSYQDPLGLGLGRSQKIVESLRDEIMGAGEETEQNLRIRQIFHSPREVYRLEIEIPELSYQRTTLLDRDALEDLLECDEVRSLLVEPIEY